MTTEKYPLSWPLGYPRTKWTRSSRFKISPFGKTRDAVLKELNMMLSYDERKSIIMSTNVPLKNDGFPYANYKQPDDKGVAVYFTYKKEAVVLCCDEYNKIEDNMWAIAKTIEALRGIERWGVSEFLKRSFAGFNALPPKSEGARRREWWVVMDYVEKPGRMPWDVAGIQAQYKSLAKARHPDVGGSVEAFQELIDAYEQAKKYFNL